MWRVSVRTLLLFTVSFSAGDLLQPKGEFHYRQVEKNLLSEVLDPHVYDPTIRPDGKNGTDGPTHVNVNIFFRSFSKIDDVKMEYSFDLTMRQQWNDARLKFADKLNQNGGYTDKIKYLTTTDAKQVWMPDTFFRNEKTGAVHNILTPNLYIRVFPNGDVLYSTRVSLVAACAMDLALFPFDKQTCHLDLASYGWTKDDLIYAWKDGGAVQFPKVFSLPDGYKLADTGIESCDVQTATGDYSCLRVNLTFARELSFYLVTIYIPCFMIVVVSWFSFWLDHKAVTARVALGVITLLAMSSTMGSIQQSLPPVAYTKAVDVWSGVCTFFVFSALLEYVLVNCASRSQMSQNKKEGDAEIIKDSPNTDSLDPLLRKSEGAHPMPVDPEQITPAHRMKNYMKNFQFQAQNIDVFSRVLFPLTFALFNCMYWSYYMTREQQN